MDDEMELDWLEESIQYDRVIPSRIYRTDLLLPRKRNVMMSLICSDTVRTVDRIRSNKVIRLPPMYRYYLKPRITVKKVSGITKRIMVDRKAIQTFCSERNLIWIPEPRRDICTITSLEDELNIYNTRMKNFSIRIGINNFLSYLDGCIPVIPKIETQTNIILIDALDYLFSRNVNPIALKGNPVYYLYYLLKNQNESLMNSPHTFVIMGDSSSIVLRPSKMDRQMIKQFINNLFNFMKTNQKTMDRLEKDLLKKDKELHKEEEKINNNRNPNPFIEPLHAVDKNTDEPKVIDKKPDNAQKPVETNIPTEEPKKNLSVIEDDDSMNDTSDSNIFDQYVSSDEEETSPTENTDTTDSDTSEEDEVFVPFSDDDPFGYEAKKNATKTKTARIRSKVIEPGSKKQQELLNHQQKIVVRANRTIHQEEEIVPGNIQVPESNHEKNLSTHNEEVTHSRYENYRKTYMEQAFDSDMVKAFTSLNTKDNAFYIKDIKISDNSDSQNYLEKWEVVVVDQYGIQSTIRLDIPKLYDNKYFYLGGNLKTLENQNIALPIVKTGPNEVIITTNYNKIFLKRYETRSITSVSRLIKMISYDSNETFFVSGNNRIDNLPYDIPLVMSEIGNVITEFHGEHCRMYFNMKLPIMKKHNPDDTSDKLWIGTNSGKDIYVDRHTGKTEDNESIIGIILQNVPEDMQDAYNNVKLGKVNMYAQMKMNMKNVPCLFVLGYWVGLREILEKSGIKYRFVPDDSGRCKNDLSEIRIKFADGCLYYEDTEYAELVLNPLLNLNVKEFQFNDMNSTETWESILVNIYGSYRSLNVIHAFYEWMIDWITLEILQMYHLPETIDGLILHGIKMLSNNQYEQEINDNLQRMRHAEVIPAMVYYRIAGQYARYTSSGGRSKMTLPQDAIVKDLLSLTTLEDASIINPLLELTKDSDISKRGFRGTNLDTAYTRALRTYSQDSVGKVAMTGGMAGNVGVQKHLTYEPDIMNIRGIRDPSKPVDQYTGANLLSAQEMLIPMAAVHDDPIRVGMGIKQAGHMIPAEESSPSLLSNGIEEAIRFRLSSEYVVNADEDGKVVEYDEKSGMMIVQYKPYDAKPGKFRAFCLKPQAVKNSGGGFYMDKKLDSPYKVGDTFKKGDVLAYHNKFFTYSKEYGLLYNIGPLIRCVIYATSEAYEDGGWMTEGAAKKMATSIVYREQAQLDRNATIDDIVKIGDHIAVNDRLITFSSGTNDAQLNKLLASLDDDVKSDLQKGRRSEHAGEIIDIQILSQVDPEECSPSVKKLLLDYQNRVKRVNTILDKYDKSPGIVKAGYMNRTPDTTVKTQYGKINGVETDILVIFQIRHLYDLSIGDKFILYSANKNTISKVVPEHYAGWSEDNPDDPIQAGISPSPLAKRMIFSPNLVLGYTTCLIELKRKILDIWDNG